MVTGAASGIGRAFAVELARRGGRVVCADIDVAGAQVTAKEIDGLAVACDVSTLEDVEALAETATAWLGEPVDLVVNNAGVGAGGLPIGETTIDDWQWTVDVNLWGMIHGCHVWAPRLRQTGRGGIINVASAASFAAAPNMGPYNVTKAGALALTETLAAELAGTGVRVTALCPTFVKTNITRNGRITESSGRLADRLMAWSGMSADRVARMALDGHDRGQLYVVPQPDAQMIWAAKRWAPSSYTRGLGLLNRITP